jgi:hypothetical protein
VVEEIGSTRVITTFELELSALVEMIQAASGNLKR